MVSPLASCCCCAQPGKKMESEFCIFKLSQMWDQWKITKSYLFSSGKIWDYLFGEHLIFCIVLFAIFSSVTYFVSVKWDFVHSVISSFASPWSHFFVLILCFSIIQNLCKLFFLFHDSISSSCLHFISFFVWQAVLNRCPDKCVTSVEKVSLWGWFFYNVLSMRKYVTSVGKIEIHFSSSQIDFI